MSSYRETEAHSVRLILMRTPRRSTAMESDVAGIPLICRLDFNEHLSLKNQGDDVRKPLLSAAPGYSPVRPPVRPASTECRSRVARSADRADEPMKACRHADSHSSPGGRECRAARSG